LIKMGVNQYSIWHNSDIGGKEREAAGNDGFGRC